MKPITVGRRRVPTKRNTKAAIIKIKDKTFYPVRIVATMLDVAPTTINYRILRGDLKPILVDGKNYFSTDELSRYIKESYDVNFDFSDYKFDGNPIVSRHNV